MDYELMFVIGAILVALSIPSILSAYADRRRPLVGAFAFLVGAGFVTVAILHLPGRITPSGVPDIFFHVIGRYIY